MKHYIFTITYSNGTKVEKYINAYDAYDAWSIFVKRAKEHLAGYAYFGDEYLSKVELAVKEV